MSTPAWKVYTADGEYVAAIKYPEDAAALVYLHAGGTVRHDHKTVVWREGAEDFSAGDSYDDAARIMRERVAKHINANAERRRAQADAFAMGISRITTYATEGTNAQGQRMVYGPDGWTVQP